MPWALAVVGSLVLAALALVTRASLVWARIPLVAWYWRRRATRPGELLYVALGDSTAQGIGASRPWRGYVGLLADDLAARTGRSVRVVNLSVTGARVADVLGSQVPRLLGILADSAPALVTVGIGSNDAGRTDVEAFRAAIQQVITALPAGSKVADVPDFQGGPRLAAAAELSEVVREEVARRPDLKAVDLYGATRAMTMRDYAGDFFHPRDSGYRRYLRAFAGDDVSGEPVDQASST